jgi:hypothetical protein
LLNYALALRRNLSTLKVIKSMQQTLQINNILQAISSLDLEDQLFLTEILDKRAIQLRREQILVRAKEAETNYQNSNVQTVNINELMMMSSNDD